MEHVEAEEAVIQWHPAFFAGIQIEFHTEESKVYGYACFYKADVAQVDSIKVDEITLPLFVKGIPGSW